MTKDFVWLRKMFSDSPAEQRGWEDGNGKFVDGISRAVETFVGQRPFQPYLGNKETLSESIDCITGYSPGRVCSGNPISNLGNVSFPSTIDR